VRLLVGAQVEIQANVGLRLGHAESPALVLVDTGSRISPQLEDRAQDVAREPTLLEALRVDV